MNIEIKGYDEKYLIEMIKIWNEVVEEGIAFPQEKLVLDCLVQGKKHGYGILQFNAVVATNIHARHLYERLGFTQLGTIRGGFRMKDGHYEDICPYYREL